jgi:limonene-1,2-epoxide hydrolase
MGTGIERTVLDFVHAA